MQQSSPCYQVSSSLPSPEISASVRLERWSTSMRGCGCRGSCVACAWFSTPPAGRLQTGHRWTPQWICSWTRGEVKQQFSLICQLFRKLQQEWYNLRYLELQLKLSWTLIICKCSQMIKSPMDKTRTTTFLMKFFNYYLPVQNSEILFRFLTWKNILHIPVIF